MPFGAKDSELIGATYTIPEGFYAVIEGNKVVMKKGEKPSTWTAEDEKLWKDAKSLAYEVEDRDLASWLIDIKNRTTQPKQEWGADDEIMMDIILNDINYAQKNSSDSKLTSYDKKVEWLKSHIHSYGK
jgi:hypothetical protein